MNDDIRFSGVVVTYNDSTHLNECLSHLSFCDELVVVDLGSSDQSVEIARQFNARVVQHAWVPMVELVRQFAVEQATHDWIVFVDPDLVFPDHLIQRVRDAIASDDGLSHVTIPYLNYYMGQPIRHGRWGGLAGYPAVLHRGRVEFPDLLHRGFRTKRGWHGTFINTRLDVDAIKHYWVDSWGHFFGKHRRYVDLEGETRFKRGARFSRVGSVLSTFAEFWRSLFWQRGILDGAIGIRLSWLWGWYTWRAWGSLKQYQDSHPDLSNAERTNRNLPYRERSVVDMRRIVRGVRRRCANLVVRLAECVRPSEAVGLNLAGDREVEWSWILSHMGQGPGQVLDFGPGPFPLLSLTASQRGYQVLALDRRRSAWPVAVTDVTFRQADVLDIELPPNVFDLVINCSTIEHVGLPGRYGAEVAVPEGDIGAMHKLRQATKPDGKMLLTLPVGFDALFAPFHRVYGPQRLPKLLAGWTVEDERYWAKLSANTWQMVTGEVAFSQQATESYYGLGCFVLRKDPA
jgi:glycosyltransferase involved in cell wall biosynthesis